MSTNDPLAAELMQLGSDPDLLGTELLTWIAEAIENHPRSQQVKIGPSEIGAPCARRIGYKLLQIPERPTPPNWKATVGTALHAWLEEVFGNVNDRFDEPRFLLEQKVQVGEVGGIPVKGSCDLFDRATGTVVDWKTVGPTQLKKYKASGPGDQYRAQAHLYGQGWVNAGHTVERVSIVFLPRNGELTDSYVWHEQFDPQVAEQALQRLAGIKLATDLTGTAALANLPTYDQFCRMCPFYRGSSTDLTTGCPGVEGAVSSPFPGLVA